MVSDRLRHISEFLDFFAPNSLSDSFHAEDLRFERYIYSQPLSGEAYLHQLRTVQTMLQHVSEKPPAVVSLPTTLQLDYPSLLNPQQLAALSCIQGPLLILAGAGSGKTRTLIHRLSYLLEQGVEPRRILLLSFTRRSAQEMLLRAQQINPRSQAHQVMGGTFHSFCAWLLRKLAPLAGLSPAFSIIDTVDSSDIIELICQELKLRSRDRAFPRKAKIHDIISKSRNLQTEIVGVLEQDYPELVQDYTEDLNLIAQAFKAYKYGNHLLDYDDLLELTHQQFKSNPAFRQKAQQYFDYIMVDEYQDTNLFQKELADYLAYEHRNLMVVGDDAQSIYGFRGARLSNILEFPLRWPDAHIVRLEQNYRSCPDILKVCNAVIARNQIAFPKQLYSKRPAGLKPQISKLYGAEDEAVWIADRILELHERISFADMAVLYRSGFHSHFLQAELIKRRIPFVVYGGIRFTERRHIKDMVAYLRILMNPFDALAWHRLLQLLPGVGKVSARQILEHIRLHQGKLNAAQFGRKKFAQALSDLQSSLEQAAQIALPANQIAFLKPHYVPLLQALESDYLQRLADLDVLIALAQKYDSLARFLTDFALEPPSQQFQDQQQPQLEDSDEKPLVLSTVHSAKGLEWKAVFIMHLLDGLFPSARALKDMAELEEERRLFYVASTRAEDHLFLTLPAAVQSFNDFYMQPSRFLAELPENSYEIAEVKDR